MQHKDVVRLLWEEMGKQRKFKWARKNGANWFSNLAGDALQFLKIQDKKVFDEQFVTSIAIPSDRTIHVPFEPGVEGAWSLNDQEDVLAHECTHFDDVEAEGVISFDLQYLFSPAQRAHRETRARQSDVEYLKFRFGVDANVVGLARQLEFYACSAEVPFVQKSLESMFATVQAGGIVTKSVKDMLTILRREAPELIALDPYAPR